MKLVAVILILLVGPAFKTCSAQINVNGIVASCNDPTCKAPFCFGTSTDAMKKPACNVKISTDDCDSAIGAISYDATTKKYKFQLAGKVEGAKGWVGIAFAGGMEMTGNAKGVACLDNGEVIFLKTEDVNVTYMLKIENSVSGGTSKVDSGWLTCEFEINADDPDFIKLNTKEKKGIFLFGNTKTGGEDDVAVTTVVVMIEYMENINSRHLDIFSALADDVKTEEETKPEQTGLDGAVSLAAGLILVGFSLILSGLAQ